MRYLIVFLFLFSRIYCQIDTNKIIVSGPSMVYNGHKIGNKQLLNLIKTYPFSETKDNLLRLHKQLRRNNRNRHIFGIYGIPCTLMGLGIMYAGTDSGKINSPSLTTFIGLTYFGFGSLTIGISQICNYRYHKKKKHIIATYNQFQ